MSIKQFAFTKCGVCAGLDSAWEQKKLDARKMLENDADSHTSGARCVGWTPKEGMNEAKLRPKALW